MKAFVLWLSIFLTVALLGHGAARAEAVAELVLLEVSELDVEDTTRMRELLDRPAVVMRLPVSATDPVHYARTLGAKQVLIFDRAQGQVLLVQPGEPEVFTRVTGDAVSRSNYAVSFIAVELLSTATSLASEAADRWDLASLWLAGSADMFWASTPYTGSLRPGLALGGLWARSKSPLGFALELGVAVSGTAARSRGLFEIEISRHDVDLRCGPAYRRGAFTLFGFGTIGLAARQATYSGPGGDEARLFAGTLGLGGQLQVGVLSSVSVTVAVSGGVLASRAEFSLQGQRALREGALTGRAALGLAFVLPVR